jgi:predicted TIM-barrel fold metal-dependent hydrolase
MERIDVHAHAFPEGYLRGIARSYPDDVKLVERPGGRVSGVWAGTPIPSFDADRRVAEMDRDAVGTEVLSAPTVYAWLDDAALDWCRELNDFQADLASRYPGRFRSFLHLPVHRPAEAAGELDRWRGRPEVAGVVFGSNMGGRYPGDPSFLPVWEAVAEHGLSVLVHPLPPPATYGPLAPPIVLFPSDTAIAAGSIIFGGLFDRFPGIRIILSHYGGVLPMIARRLDMATDIGWPMSGFARTLPAAPSSYVGRFYADTAQGYHGPSFDMAREVFGVDHLLYGSDHFLDGSRWRPRLNETLGKVGLARRDLRAVLGDNARRVLGGGPCESCQGTTRAEPA